MHHRRYNRHIQPERKHMSTYNKPESITYTPEREIDTRLKFKPMHYEQVLAIECMEQNAITFLSGPAGTAKTFCATYYAYRGALDKTFRKVYISRPAVTQGADIGFLPGTAEEKMAPFLQPIINSYKKQANFDTAKINAMQQATEVLPLCFIRGMTIEDSILIVDEAQNLAGPEIIAIMTRLGAGGKIVFCGDTRQSDLRTSVLDLAANDFNGLSKHGRSSGWFNFSKDAIVRDPLVEAIVTKAETCEWANVG